MVFDSHGPLAPAFGHDLVASVPPAFATRTATATSVPPSTGPANSPPTLPPPRLSEREGRPGINNSKPDLASHY